MSAAPPGGVLGDLPLPGSRSAPKSKPPKSKKKNSSFTLKQPGKADEYDLCIREVLSQQHHDGFHFSFNKGIGHQTQSQQFAVGHTVILGSRMLSNPQNPKPVNLYEFNAFCTQNEANTVLRGGMTRGRNSAMWLQKWNSQFSTKMSVNSMAPNPMMPEYSQDVQIDADYEAKHSTAHISLTKGKTWRFNYFKNVWPSVFVGFESAGDWNKTTHHLSYMSRWQKSNSEAVTFAVQPVQTSPTDFMKLVTLGYAKTVSNQIRICTQWQFAPHTLDSNWILGASLFQEQSMGKWQGSISSNGDVSATLEEMINPMMKFSVCGKINQFSQTANFGFGLEIGV